MAQIQQNTGTRNAKQQRESTMAMMVKGKMPMPKGSCPGGKLRYETKGEAEKALEIIQRQRAARGGTVVEKRVYDDCSYRCGGFHMTKLAEWREKK